LTDPRTQPSDWRGRNAWHGLLLVAVGALAIAYAIAAYRHDFYCMAGVLLFVPATFAVAQVVMLLSLDGAWRVWCALPSLVVVVVFGWGLIVGKAVGQLLIELVMSSAMGLLALGVLWAARATLGKADQGP